MIYIENTTKNTPNNIVNERQVLFCSCFSFFN